MYGATDCDYREEEWLDRFTEEIDKIKMHEATKKADAVVNYYHYGRKDPKTIVEFWRHVENLFDSMRKDRSQDSLTAIREVTQFLCLRKDRSGWVVVSKGSNIKLFCNAKVAFQACKEFEAWKRSLLTEAGLDDAFGKHYRERLPDPRDCKHLKLKTCLSDIYGTLECPECGRAMEIESVTYVCCHGLKPAGPDASVEVKIIK